MCLSALAPGITAGDIAVGAMAAAITAVIGTTAAGIAVVDGKAGAVITAEMKGSAADFVAAKPEPLTEAEVSMVAYPAATVGSTVVAVVFTAADPMKEAASTVAEEVADSMAAATAVGTGKFFRH